MREQHLSDEALAAFADDRLGGHARERAARHVAACAECGYAVAEQRAAVWALRTAPAPALPTALAARLRELPAHAPLPEPAAAVDERGRPMLSVWAPPAAFVPVAAASSAGSTTPGGAAGPRHRGRAIALGVASALAASAVAGAVVVADRSDATRPAGPANPAGSPPAHVRDAAPRLAGYLAAVRW